MNVNIINNDSNIGHDSSEQVSKDSRDHNYSDSVNHDNGIKCIYLNSRSLMSVSRTHNKPMQLQNLVSLNNPDLVAVSESWLKSHVGSQEIFPSDYAVHRKDRAETIPGKRAGGVLLAVKNKIPSLRRPDLETSCEILVCELRPNDRKKIAMVIVYNPPKSDLNAFCQSLNESLCKVTKEFEHACILGDFNCPGIPWSVDNNCAPSLSELCQLICDYSLTQLNFIPSNETGNILDLIFTNQPEVYSDVTELDADFRTDHTLLTFSINLNCRPKHIKTRTVYNYSRADFIKLRSLVSDLPLCEGVSKAGSIDEAWQLWSESVKQAIDECVPQVKVKSSSGPPWLDGETRHLHNQKMTAWRRAKKSDKADHWARFRELRNKLSSLISRKHQDFINSLAEQVRTNTKRFWSYFRSKTKSRAMPNCLKKGDIVITDSAEMASEFNDYFYSVFKGDEENHDLPEINVISDTALSSVEFKENDIVSILQSLDSNKATGPDNISPRVLKECAAQLAPSLAALFKLSMSLSQIPSEWKNANVTPIFKKGERDKTCNYRPVSLLSCVSKVMERCVFNHIYSKVEDALHPLQHGFVKGKSCSTQLLEVYNEVGRVLDNGGQADIVFLDFSKAFDSVSHPLLLHKLKQYGINGPLLNWLSSYLSNRKQRVVVNGEASGWLPVTSGVPQGSILGPLLFLLFINDMPSVVNAPIALFADDAKLFKEIRSREDSLSLQQDIDKLLDWGKRWGMVFNVLKCKVLRVTRSRPKTFTYIMDTVELEIVETFKDLGILISSDLSWGAQTDEVVSKCNRLMGMVKRTVGYSAPPNVTLTLYQSLVRSNLDYASSVWAPHSRSHMLRLETIQRSASRYILHYPDNNYQQRCMELNLLPLSYRREINDILFLFKCMQGTYNVNIDTYIDSVPANTGLRSSSRGILLRSRRTRTESFKHSFFNRVVHIWNSLPENARNCTDLIVFKRMVLAFYRRKLETNYNIDNPCTWTSTCRCISCLCNNQRC